MLLLEIFFVYRVHLNFNYMFDVHFITLNASAVQTTSMFRYFIIIIISYQKNNEFQLVLELPISNFESNLGVFHSLNRVLNSQHSSRFYLTVLCFIQGICLFDNHSSKGQHFIWFIKSLLTLPGKHFKSLNHAQVVIVCGEPLARVFYSLNDSGEHSDVSSLLVLSVYPYYGKSRLIRS